MRSLRTIGLVLAACAGLGLAACGETTSGAGPAPSTGNTTVDNIVSKTQDVCNYIPTAATVAAVVGAWTGTGAFTDLATQVATAICGAVTKKSARRGARPSLNVNGKVIPIAGRFAG